MTMYQLFVILMALFVTEVIVRFCTWKNPQLKALLIATVQQVFGVVVLYTLGLKISQEAKHGHGILGWVLLFAVFFAGMLIALPVKARTFETWAKSRYFERATKRKETTCTQSGSEQ